MRWLRPFAWPLLGVASQLLCIVLLDDFFTHSYYFGARCPPPPCAPDLVTLPADDLKDDIVIDDR